MNTSHHKTASLARRLAKACSRALFKANQTSRVLLKLITKQNHNWIACFYWFLQVSTPLWLVIARIRLFLIGSAPCFATFHLISQKKIYTTLSSINITRTINSLQCRLGFPCVLDLGACVCYRWNISWNCPKFKLPCWITFLSDSLRTCLLHGDDTTLSSPFLYWNITFILALI